MPFIPLFQSPKSFYRLAVASFFFLQGLVFASWASRIPDIKQALDLNEAQLGGVLFAIPVGQMSAMALSGYLVSRFGSHRMLLLAALLYSGTLMALGFISEAWQLFAMLVFFGVAANLHNISVNTQAVGVERLYRRSIMAAFHGLWSLAGFVGGIIGALLAAFSVSPRVHFCFIFAVCMGIMAIMFRLTLPRRRHSNRLRKRDSNVTASASCVRASRLCCPIPAASLKRFHSLLRHCSNCSKGP